MSQNSISDEILFSFSPFSAPNSKGSSVSRSISLPKSLHEDLALIILGVRRCGKSTLLAQLPEHYNIDPLRTFFFNFEDPRYLPYTNHLLLSQIVQSVRARIGKSGPCYFFFDEIQNIENWEKWLHIHLQSHEENFFIITGSNHALLSGEYGAALTGRHRTIELFPFSWMEAKTINPDLTLQGYLESGGFPKVLQIEEPHELLREYFKDIVMRDIFQRAPVRNAKILEHLVHLVYQSSGSQLSYRKIASTLGASVETIQSYLQICQDAYLVLACPFFSFSLRKSLTQNKKFYPIDTGLRIAVVGSKQRDHGKNLEILVFLTLKQRYGEVYYWDNAQQHEVDFVVQHMGTITPYQVSWDGALDRHERALSAFYSEYPEAGEAIFVSFANLEEFLKG